MWGKAQNKVSLCSKSLWRARKQWRIFARSYYRVFSSSYPVQYSYEKNANETTRAAVQKVLHLKEHLEFFYWSRNKSENSEVYLRSFEVILDALNAISTALHKTKSSFPVCVGNLKQWYLYLVSFLSSLYLSLSCCQTTCKKTISVFQESGVVPSVFLQIRLAINNYSELRKKIQNDTTQNC